MAYGTDSSRQDRAQSMVAVIAIHAALGYALVSGMGMDIAKRVDAGLKVINITPPQPPVPAPDKKPAKEEEGGASPENLRAKASQIVLPPPEVKLKIINPVVVAPVAGTGTDNKAGASDRPGPGSGSGGLGQGSGSGSSGDGTGSGGIVSGPRHLSGAMTRKDIPRSVWNADTRGNVVVRFTVGADGRARDCRISQSSGHPALDKITCRLIEARFRFEPARDERGRAVASPYGWVQEWWRDGRGPQRLD
ncbi:TonB family protein [Parasphingorhabdus sp.]|uniref:energy transducer TonB n=1 Tax=Parasphingorhabdus sp. TaxID=2709688 RepID=UPI002B270F38|nr:TonB family protein [Parasphingorhabdus sp.]|tara:strand:+ start:4091 stop:4837 length:747 start_codon:yes stop_codon:yes gene_type:complete